MSKENIKDIIYMIIAIALGIIAVKFMIWLLPIILIVICSYYIYKSIKSRKQQPVKQTKKNIKIIEMENSDSNNSK